MTSIYLIGSLRNPKVREVAVALRGAGYDVFDDWHSAGPEADDHWQQYEKERKRSYVEALNGYHANMVFDLDLEHLTRCNMAVLVLPAGKSGHLELGYMLGQGKPGFVLLNGEPERFDIMYKLATCVCESVDALLAVIGWPCKAVGVEADEQYNTREDEIARSCRAYAREQKWI